MQWLLEQISNIVGWAVDLAIGALNLLLITVVYKWVVGIMIIGDMCYVAFRKMAGLETVSYNGATVDDPLLAILTDPAVLNALLALAILAVAMVLVFAMIMMIKTEFNADGKNSKGTIINSSLRALFMFAIVPVTAIGGILLSNALLRSLDAATGGGPESTLGSQVMAAALADGNVFRRAANGELLIDRTFSVQQMAGMGVTVSSEVSLKNGNLTDQQLLSYAASLDTAFRNNTLFGEGFGSGIAQMFPYMNVPGVLIYYSILDVNAIIMIVAPVVATWILLSAFFGLIMRIFNMAFLFIVSPPIIATSVIKGDKAFGQWKTKFIGYTLGAYGTVVGLNLFFLLLPLIDSIVLFLPGELLGLESIVNNFVSLVILLVGLFMMKDLPKLISDIIDAKDASQEGEGMMKKVGGTAVQIGMAAATGGGSMVGGLASKLGGAAGKLGSKVANSSVGLAIKDSKAKKRAEKATQKGFKDADGNMVSGEDIKNQRLKALATSEPSLLNGINVYKKDGSLTSAAKKRLDKAYLKKSGAEQLEATMSARTALNATDAQNSAITFGDKVGSAFNSAGRGLKTAGGGLKSAAQSVWNAEVPWAEKVFNNKKVQGLFESGTKRLGGLIGEDNASNFVNATTGRDQSAIRSVMNSALENREKSNNLLQETKLKNDTIIYDFMNMEEREVTMKDPHLFAYEIRNALQDIMKNAGDSRELQSYNGYASGVLRDLDKLQEGEYKSSDILKLLQKQHAATAHAATETAETKVKNNISGTITLKEEIKNGGVDLKSLERAVKSIETKGLLKGKDLEKFREEILKLLEEKLK